MQPIESMPRRLRETPDADALRERVRRLEEQLRQREDNLAYRELQQRVTDLIHLATPRGSTVLVVSKGDDELVDLNGRRGWHFPRAVNGLYAGCYPADSGEAIDHLRRLQTEGAEYLVIPSSSFWWLEFYGGLTRHLQRRHRLAATLEDICVVFRLLETAGTSAGDGSLSSNGKVRH
jgi:hypothetical protein